MSQFLASGDQSIESFSFSINPSNDYSGLVSFRMDLLDLLAVQRTLKSLLLPPNLPLIASLPAMSPTHSHGGLELQHQSFQ